MNNINLFLILILVILLLYNIFKKVEEFQLQEDPKLDELREIFRNFFKQDKVWKGSLDMLNNRDIMNEITLYRGKKSYTINKEKIFLCLKDEKDDYYPTNMLIYVLAHEYSHALSKSIGHTPEFYEIFESILIELTDDKFYDPNIPIINNYCEYD